MKAIAKYSFMLIVALPMTAFAAGGAHHEPSIKDLIYPGINFFLLVVLIDRLIRKKARDMFNKNASDVESLMNSAAQKNKDAQERLATLQSKMSNLGLELSKIQKDYDSDVLAFTHAQANETQTIIARSKRDFESKLEGEKNELVEKLNAELLDSVIAKTRQAISSNNDMKNRATSKIISELR